MPSYIYIRIYSRIRHNIALGYRHQLYFFFFVFFFSSITYHELWLVSRKKSARSTGRQLFLQTRTPNCSKNRESESRTMRNNEAPVTSTIRLRRKYISNATVFYKYTFVQLLYCTLLGTLFKRGPTYTQKFRKIRRIFLSPSHASIF